MIVNMVDWVLSINLLFSLAHDFDPRHGRHAL